MVWLLLPPLVLGRGPRSTRLAGHDGGRGAGLPSHGGNGRSAGLDSCGGHGCRRRRGAGMRWRRTGRWARVARTWGWPAIAVAREALAQLASAEEEALGCSVPAVARIWGQPVMVATREALARIKLCYMCPVWRMPPISLWTYLNIQAPSVTYEDIIKRINGVMLRGHGSEEYMYSE
ncbi:UNVERIFIED_CONTAM: hypothetical protein K2H54_047257 [Gekko kuhli]